MNNVIRIISGRMGRNRIQYTGVRLDGFINEDRDDGSAISGLFFFFFHLLSFPLSSSIPLRISRIVVISNIAIITLIPMIQKLVFGLGFALFTICFRYIYISRKAATVSGIFRYRKFYCPAKLFYNVPCKRAGNF